MKTYQQCITSEFVNSTSKDWIDVINPFNEQVVALAPNGNSEDADAALEAAEKAQPAWTVTPAAQRAVFLKTMAEAITSHLQQRYWAKRLF